jgi:hypothetical protein
MCRGREGLGRVGCGKIRKQHLTLHNCLCIKTYLMNKSYIVVAI